MAITSSTTQADQAAARLAQVVSASTLNNPIENKTEGSTAADTEDRFLKLLVAQMRNQDPLNPLDNAQVTTQLAQINTVRGIETLNTSVSKLVDRGATASPLDSVGLLGRQVLVSGDKVERAAGDASTRLGFELPAAAKKALAEVVDSAGNTVFSKIFDAPPAGLTVFDWDGTDGQGNAVAPGGYKLRVTAADGNKVVEAATLAPARVIGVSQASDGVRLELAGRASVAPGAVKAIL